ncbi:hypothetical protein ACBJ59_49630 [Nonomuraea sp. MTCD27]|uniref:hypothetical protein n=1 Tax=Nonomuraea sp. MTCD27 TaxID=1676747 RepID=UPI0035C2698D
MANRQSKAIVELQRYADKYVQAKIIFYPVHEYPRAQEVEALFRLAGWKTAFNKTPQDGRVSQYFGGVEIAGCNSHLVAVVQSALSQAGVPELRTALLKNEVDQDNPKYPHVERSIRVTIGHISQPITVASSGLAPADDRKSSAMRSVLKWLIFSAVYSLPVALFDWVSFQEKSQTWALPAFLGTGSICLLGFAFAAGGLSDLLFDSRHKGGELPAGFIASFVACAIMSMAAIVVYILVQRKPDAAPTTSDNWSVNPTLSLLIIIGGGLAGLAAVLIASVSRRQR